MIKVVILTISDTVAAGERKDRSGPLIGEILPPDLFQIMKREVIPDEKGIIEKKLLHHCDRLKTDLILTTGGTGLSSRDVTPEATETVVEKEVPGLSEATRREGFRHTPHALLSRAIAGIRKETLIINLPGSPKGVKESLEVILPSLPHAIELLKGKSPDSE